MNTLKPKDREIYDFIQKAISEQGYCPSVRDILTALGIKSTSTVHASLCRLESADLIVRGDGKSRAIRLKNDSARYNQCRIPVLSKLKSAVAFDSEHNFSGYINFALPKETDPRDVFAYKISGNGVERLGILDGDYVIVKRCDEANSGDIIAYASNGDLFIKPYSSIKCDTSLLGKVIASIKFF